jgi:hypothetical protein
VEKWNDGVMDPVMSGGCNVVDVGGVVWYCGKSSKNEAMMGKTSAILQRNNKMKSSSEE